MAHGNVYSFWLCCIKKTVKANEFFPGPKPKNSYSFSYKSVFYKYYSFKIKFHIPYELEKAATAIAKAASTWVLSHSMMAF